MSLIAKSLPLRNAEHVGAKALHQFGRPLQGVLRQAAPRRGHQGAGWTQLLAIRPPRKRRRALLEMAPETTGLKGAGRRGKQIRVAANGHLPAVGSAFSPLPLSQGHLPHSQGQIRKETTRGPRLKANPAGLQRGGFSHVAPQRVLRTKEAHGLAKGLGQDGAHPTRQGLICPTVG